MKVSISAFPFFVRARDEGGTNGALVRLRLGRRDSLRDDRSSNTTQECDKTEKTYHPFDLPKTMLGRIRDGYRVAAGGQFADEQPESKWIDFREGTERVFALRPH